MKIIVREMGGLGNQLFQYAAGVYYSTRCQVPLLVAADPDPHAASAGYPRPFQLSMFQIQAPIRPATKLERVLLTTNRRFRLVAAGLRGLLGAKLFEEPEPFRFLPELPARKRASRVYLRAYWQAAGYAAGVESRLREELTLKSQPTGKNLEMLKRIAASPCPVSVHLRRGDYRLGPHDLTLPMHYYEQAILSLRQRFSSPELFVFSDDIEFASQNLSRVLPMHFVGHNDEFSAFEDLRLMAACRHHIIANSTFSWWGAWLNPRADKVVFSPKHWRGRTPSYYPDLYPAGWEIIDNLVPSP